MKKKHKKNRWSAIDEEQAEYYRGHNGLPGDTWMDADLDEDELLDEEEFYEGYDLFDDGPPTARRDIGHRPPRD